MSHYRPYLLMCCHNISPAVLVWCISIDHAFLGDASLQAMPSGAVPHYQPSLLVCCLTIGHAFWCGASSSTMPVGVVPHYRPCLLAWYVPHYVHCHCNQQFTSRVQMEEGWLQVWCYLYRGAIISDMSDDPRSDMPSCTMQLLSDIHARFMNSSTHVCKVMLYQARYLA